VKCFGRNHYGQLGYGDSFSRGNDNNEMGDYLPYIFFDGNPVSVHIYVGWSHSCAVAISGGLRCWGKNNQGQLGVGHNMTLGDGVGEVGSLQDINISHPIINCLEVAPTFTPTSTFIPSVAPTTIPTFNPTPNSIPASTDLPSLHPTSSFNPTFSPTLGSALQQTFQHPNVTIYQTFDIFNDSWIIIGGSTTISLYSTSSGGQDWILEKRAYDGFGLEWGYQNGSDDYDFINSLLVDQQSGLIYVNGVSAGDNFMGSNIGTQDIIFAIYDQDGSLISGTRTGSVNLNTIQDMFLVEGSIYTSGHSLGDFLGTNIGISDIFLLKLNASNISDFSGIRVGTPKNDELEACAATNTSLFITGSTAGSFYNISHGFFLFLLHPIFNN